MISKPTGSLGQVFPPGEVTHSLRSCCGKKNKASFVPDNVVPRSLESTPRDLRLIEVPVIVSPSLSIVMWDDDDDTGDDDRVRVG
jgi:hypothetical protein